MARKVNQATTEPGEDDLAVSVPAALPGGAPGIIEDAIQTIPEPGKPTAVVPPDLRPEVRQLKPPPRFQVVNGGHVWLNGYGALIRAGRIIDETMYDLELLKKQGIQLRAVE